MKINFSAILISIAVLFICTHTLGEHQFSPGSDEGYYYRYAKTISAKGTSGFHELIQWYAASDEARKHPTPMRIGYIGLTSVLFHFFGPSYNLLGLVSLFSFLLFLIGCFYFCRRNFGQDIAFLFTLFLSSSPLMLAMSRRALLDSSINLLWGVLVWIFLEFLAKPTRLRFGALFILFTIALSFKEMSLVLIPFFLIAGFVARKYDGSTVSVGQLLGLTFGPVLVLVGSYALLLGVDDLIKGMMAVGQTHFEAQHPNPYAINYSSGPWFRYLVDFMLLTPVITVLFIGYFFTTLTKPSIDWKKAYFLMYFVIVFALLSSLAHSKVVRFAINLEMVLSLFAALMIIELGRGVAERMRQRVIAVTVAGIFILNFQSFFMLFYFSQLLDPITYHLAVLRHFIPGQ